MRLHLTILILKLMTWTSQRIPLLSTTLAYMPDIVLAPVEISICKPFIFGPLTSICCELLESVRHGEQILHVTKSALKRSCLRWGHLEGVRFSFDPSSPGFQIRVLEIHQVWRAHNTHSMQCCCCLRTDAVLLEILLHFLHWTSLHHQRSGTLLLGSVVVLLLKKWGRIESGLRLGVSKKMTVPLPKIPVSKVCPKPPISHLDEPRFSHCTLPLTWKDLIMDMSTRQSVSDRFPFEDSQSWASLGPGPV